MSGFILVLNCGSSSIKFALFEAGSATLPRQAAWNGKVQGIGGPTPDFGARTVQYGLSNWIRNTPTPQRCKSSAMRCGNG